MSDNKHQNFQTRNSLARGFTLVEVLVVLAIISILGGIVMLNLVGKPAEARVTAAKTTLRALKSAVNTYRIDNGTVPTMQQGLQALITKPTTPPIPQNYPDGGYLDTRQLPRDPWNNDYIYLVPGRRGEAFEIITYGSDGQPGGEGDAADISSSDL
ncbi:MAG TPA: type II secretion system major pseudopilin GspG [Kiritimatiellia bacterium]|nr:type II secretion system major pseudopilin GspG [Kiritimatiellia bacterium]